MKIDGVLDDIPITEDAHLWPGLHEFAQRLAETLPAFPASSSVLLSGDWGAGKTTLMLALQRRLKDSEVATVWFDAWRYEGETALLPALMRTVWEAAPPEVAQDQAAVKVFKTVWRCAVAVGIRAAPVAASLAGFPILGSLMTGWTAKGLDDDIKAAASGDDSFEPPTDSTQLLWQSFAKLIERAWPDRKVLIMIDDLDRCSPEGAVSLLDGIRLLIAGTAGKTPCHFIVSLDRKVLTEGIRRKFGGISSYDGNRYLEKIFPLSFDLPTLAVQDVGKLLERFLSTRASADDKVALTEALSQPVFANPRLMKRCINRFCLVTHFERASKGKPGDIERNRTLAKWIAATERWPRLRWLMRVQTDAYWENLSSVLRSPEARPDPDVESLLREEGGKTWLQQEILPEHESRVKEFRAAEGRLQKWGM